jgi:hypothetical protein
LLDNVLTGIGKKVQEEKDKIKTESQAKIDALKQKEADRKKKEEDRKKKAEQEEAQKAEEERLAFEAEKVPTYQDEISKEGIEIDQLKKIKVTVPVIEAETGKKRMSKGKNAHEALKDIDNQIDSYYSILECLKS